MLLRKFPGKTLCATAVVAFAATGVSACDKGGSESASADGTNVAYEIVSSTGKPFKVTYVEKTDADSVSDIAKSMATATATASWKKEVALSKGSDYAMVVVVSDPQDLDTATKYSCKITSGGKTVDEKKDQAGFVVGCAGLKLQDQVKQKARI